MSRNTLLISPQTVKDRSVVHKNVDDSLIYPEIKIAQDMKIVEALGTNLLERLQDGIDNNDLTPDETTLLNDYVVDCMVQFTLAGLPVGSSYQFFTKGVLRRSNENSELPSMSDMLSVAAQYDNRGEFYRQRLINYLNTNCSLFPQYTACGNDINPNSSGYSVSCWLGDD